MIILENEKKYNKFYQNFDSIIRKLAQLQPILFNHIDLEDFIMFFEEPCSKGKNKGLPRNYNIFNQCLKNSKTKFSDDNYIADVCLAMTYEKVKCRNGLNTTTSERMVYMYRESAHCKTAFVDYESLENELYTDDITPSLIIANDLEDIIYHKVFERGYLNSYFNGSDIIMLKEYIKSLEELSGETNIKDFTNQYLDSRMLSNQAYEKRLRNVFKAWVAVLIVEFDLWDELKGFEHNPFKSFKESVDFLNNLKPLKERKEYMKKLNKDKEPKTSTPEDIEDLSRDERRSRVLKRYLIQKFGLSNVKKSDEGFEVKTNNKWCVKYFLNGGYNNCKTGEKGSWLKDLKVSN